MYNISRLIFQEQELPPGGRKLWEFLKKCKEKDLILWDLTLLGQGNVMRN